MAFTTIVNTAELASHLADPQWIAIDCRFQLADESWGERQHAVAHVPGAPYAHLGRDLSGPPTGTNGRHPLPGAAELARTCSRLGIGNGMQVVAYDQDSGMFASRLWWLLRWLGHERVAVLDGGFAKWTAENRPVAAGNNAPAPKEFTGSPQPAMTADIREVAALVARRDGVLVDARAPERYRGDVEPLDRRAGHIPGAINYFFQRNVDSQGLFRSPDELRRQLAEALGSAPPDRVVCYCGSGVTACHNLLAMEMAGLPGARLFAGSWSEWSSDPSRPAECGDHEKRPAL